nr:hypothetical protein [uncultured Allomuricauda sp.]
MKKYLLTSLGIFLCWSTSRAQTVIKPDIVSETYFAIVVDKATYNGATDELMAYKKSVEDDGLGTFVIYHGWKNPDQIKNVLKKLYTGRKSPIEGAVFVGNIPIPMIREAQYLTSTFKMPERISWERSSVPSDRFYDDFDLEFEFLKQDEDSTRSNLFYYKIKPESPQYLEMDIYTGRIKPPHTKGDVPGIEMIRAYLSKLVHIKNEQNKLDRMIVSTGHGYNSNSTASWGGEVLAFRSSFPELFKPGNSIKFLNYRNTDFLKDFLITELQREDLDLAFMTGHGTADLQLLNGYPDVSSPQPSMENVARYIRSKMRSAKERGRDMEETKKRFQESLGLSDKWFDDAFNQERIREDSIFNINMDINKNDLNNINARVAYINSCLTGSFQLDDYLAGHYPFSKGKNVVAFANSVGVLQDLWGTQYLGILQHGVRTGQLLRETAFLETHILGDPTYHFYAEDQEELNTLFAQKTIEEEPWEHLLEIGDADLKAYALNKLFAIKEESDFSEELFHIFKTSPYESVRAEAYFLLRRYQNDTFFQAHEMAMKDNYEYIRRKSVFDIVEMGHKELVEKSVDMYLENLEANRITYKLKWAFQFLDYDKVLEALDKRLKNKPTIHNATELYNNLHKKVSYEKEKAKKMKDVLSSSESTDKQLLGEIRTLRAYRYHSLVPDIIAIVANKDKSEEVRIKSLEALSWFGLSYQQDKIKALCQDLMSSSNNKTIIEQAKKTLNVIQDVGKRPF